MSQLPVRSPIYTVPRYSLTGDLLSFRRCALQYRYLNGSALPPSRPVQLWFGEFIHGAMEMAIRHYQEGDLGPLPWAQSEIQEKISTVVANRLAGEGKTARSMKAEENARARAEMAINQLGPILFPLVDSPEVTLSGTRSMSDAASYRADYYEITGRIDVVTSFRLDGYSPGKNAIVDTVRRAIPNAPAGESFEVLVDYKGMRRPADKSEEWRLYEWQLQTYAWLRQQQPESLPVRAGLVIFVNELLPSPSDMGKLKEDIANDASDVRPEPNSNDQRMVLGAPKNQTPFGLSWGFRLARALRAVTVETSDRANALGEFDEVVADIEASVAREVNTGSIQSSWVPIPEDETCIACDFNTMCPASPYRGAALAPLGRRAPSSE